MGNFKPETQMKLNQLGKIKNFKNYNIYRNIFSGNQFQEYSLSFQNQHSLHKNLQIFNLRKLFKNTYNIVQVIQTNIQQQTLCTNFNILKVYIERIPYKLQQIFGIQQQDAINLLDQILIGYKILYEYFGPFDITQQMMGFNKQGNIRVWFHQNFIENQPKRFKKNEKYEQKQMMIEIFTAIEKMLIKQQFSINFSQYLENTCVTHTFQKIRQCILNYKNYSGIKNKKKYLNQKILEMIQKKKLTKYLNSSKNRKSVESSMTKKSENPYEERSFKQLQMISQKYKNCDSTWNVPEDLITEKKGPTFNTKLKLLQLNSQFCQSSTPRMRKEEDKIYKFQKYKNKFQNKQNKQFNFKNVTFQVKNFHQTIKNHTYQIKENRQLAQIIYQFKQNLNKQTQAKTQSILIRQPYTFNNLNFTQ